MKKFLSILLALAVGFTFTFGSAMSAFADTAPTYPNAGSNLDKAYQTALAAAANETFYVDYETDNTIDMGEIAENNLVTYAFSQAAVKAAVDKAYKQIEKETTVLSDAAVEGDVYKQAAYYTAIMNAIKGTGYTLAGTSDAVSVDDVTAAMFATDFDAYKAVLLEAVGKVDISDYSSTNYKDNNKAEGYEAKDTEKYDTSAEAAAADIALAKAIISNASMSDAVTQTEDKTIAWKAASYNALYGEVFGAGKIIIATENTSKATVKYTLANGENYSTISGESKNTNVKANTILINKAALATYLLDFNYANLTKTQQEEYDAFNTAQTWLIENYCSAYDEAVTFGGSGKVLNVDDDSYTKADALVKYANNKAAIVKAMKNADGTLAYDAEKVDESLNTITESLYELSTTYNTEEKIDTVLMNSANAATYVTSTTIALNLIDYSSVTATGAYGDAISLDMSTASTTIGERAYYAKEWETVKAAIDTYNEAIKAAKTNDDIAAAKKAFEKAVKDVATASAVASATVYTADAANLMAYVTLAKNAAMAADKNVAEIFVKFGDAYISGAKVATSTPSVDDSVKGWYIDKGARKAADVTALTAEAKAVIDAYKTDLAVRTAADDVKAAIAALPAKVTLADKAAVEAAYNALKELKGTGYEGFVSNSGTLTKDINAIKKLEKAEVEKAVKALPSRTKVTVADKAAVKAAKEANDAYVNTEMYNLRESDVAGVSAIETLLDAIRVLEAQDLNTKIEALAAKDITTADAADVKAAREAFEAYVAEYGVANAGTVVISDMEKKLAEIEKKLAVAEDAAKWNADDAKAYVQDLAIAVRTAKSGKKVKVTVNADVQTLIDNGFTVEYKFYKSTKKSSGYKNTVNKTTNTYTNTNPVKGKNYYKVKLVVKNADGTVVATTPLTQCKYGVRTIK